MTMKYQQQINITVEFAFFRMQDLFRICVLFLAVTKIQTRNVPVDPTISDLANANDFVKATELGNYFTLKHNESLVYVTESQGIPINITLIMLLLLQSKFSYTEHSITFQVFFNLQTLLSNDEYRDYN